MEFIFLTAEAISLAMSGRLSGQVPIDVPERVVERADQAVQNAEQLASRVVDEATLANIEENLFYFFMLALIVWGALHLYNFIARFILFKKLGIPRWKALIPFYGAALNFKAFDMSGLWVFAQVPIMLVTIFSLNLPIWLTGLVYLLSYGVDFVYAIHFAKSFHRKWPTGTLAFIFPRTMRLVAGFSKKITYDDSTSRLKYAKVGDKYVPLADKKREQAKLIQATMEAERRELLAEPEPAEKKGFLKHITDWLVVHHKLVLSVMLAIAAACVVLMTKVNVNKDLTRYMPTSSETSQGLNIMYDEFNNVLAMPLSVMVKGLSTTEKQQEYTYLESLDGVKSIDYDDSSKYNQGDYTLYELTVTGKADGPVASTLFETIKSHYHGLGKTINFRGEVAMMNTPPLEIWVVAVAVIAALIILIIMSESYVEPVLYLVAIGLAIAINMGTNAFMPSVSQITNSITAVLQLALSMDYSIMLATEFHREKLRGKDKISAMKSALSRAFTAISASSVTTIVGMLVLLLMSFTIGRDLGIVLAKGVFFCLISIFTALPALLLIFDPLVEKTKKSPFAPRLDLLGEISYKIRKFAIPIFIVILGGSCILQAEVSNYYSNSDSAAIDAVFGPYNQSIIIYDRADEATATTLCKKLDAEDITDEVLCYGNTINDPVTTTEFKPKLEDLGSSVDMSDERVRFLYYHYYDHDESHTLTLDELADYLLNADGELADFITPSMRDKLSKLRLFANTEESGTWRSSLELSQILDMPFASVKDIMILNDARYDIGEQMTLPELVSYIETDVMTDPTYAAMLPADLGDKLTTIKGLAEFSHKFTKEEFNQLDAAINSNNLTPQEISALLTALEIPAEQQPMVMAMLSQGAYVLRAIVNEVPLTATDIATNLGVDESSARMLYALHASKSGRGTAGMSLKNVVYFLKNYVMNSKFASRLDADQQSKINALATILDEADTTQSGAGLYNLISPLSNDISKNKLDIALIYHGATYALPDDYKMTVEQVVNFLNDTVIKDERMGDIITDDTRLKADDAKNNIADAKSQMLGENYGRIVIRTKLSAEGEQTFDFISHVHDEISAAEFTKPTFVVGNSAMAYEMSQTFPSESLMITIVTAIAIYIVVAISFKSWSIPLILVLVIQTAVWVTMAITGMTDGNIYFLSLIIVQSLLMGATIDYAIMYTEQYVAARNRGVKLHEAVILAYNKSIQAILTSAGVLTIVTAIVGNLAGGIAAKICRTISDGTFFSTLLVLLVLPALIAACDRIIIKKSQTSTTPKSTKSAKSAKSTKSAKSAK
ncbi:MMPL family transporter [Candidatus Saccharibacteria bacterium]|nr:MMPL family transporter [Candidatus Saccharibacteria bacterium]